MENVVKDLALRAHAKDLELTCRARSRSARRAGRRSGAAAAGAPQPGRQRHQVHRPGRGRTLAVRRIGAQRQTSDVWLHSPSATPASAFRQTSWRRSSRPSHRPTAFRHANVRRHRPGLDHLRHARRHDGRPHLGGESRSASGSTFHFTRRFACRTSRLPRRAEVPARTARLCPC